jgi:hypothetical protein
MLRRVNPCHVERSATDLVSLTQNMPGACTHTVCQTGWRLTYGRNDACRTDRNLGPSSLP